MLIIDKEINAYLKSNYDAAKNSIEMICFSITMPSKSSSLLFINTWRSLEMAIKRGVKTRIIMETWNDLNPQASANNKARIELEALGAEVRMASKGICMHSKTWLFDRSSLIIGSHNSTEAGFCRTKNLSVQLVNRPEVGEYIDYFDQNWAELAPFKHGAI